jgi:hypothetical protein
MDKQELLKLIDSVQRYGTECPMVPGITEREENIYRNAWFNALEELKQQLTQRP